MKPIKRMEKPLPGTGPVPDDAEADSDQKTKRQAVESDIAVGSMFTPGTINLPAFLQEALACAGKKDQLVKAVNSVPVQVKTPKGAKTPRTARLPIEAAVQFGLLEEGSWLPTDLCKHLATLPEAKLYDEFARHIMLNLHGLRIVEAAQQMALDEPLTGVSINGNSLAVYLSNQGLRVGVQNMQIFAYRGWLAKAGIFPLERTDAWRVSEDAKRRVIGLASDEISSIAAWSVEDRALALALCRLDSATHHNPAKVREMAEANLGRTLDRGNLRDLFEPLIRVGYVTVESGGTRAGKAGTLTILPKFKADVIEPFLKRAATDLDPHVLELYKWTATEIRKNLDHKDSHTKGLALEAYAVRMMRLLGLRFLRWREQGPETGGTEVDIILAGIYGGIPTRWQVQCKNKPKSKVTVEDVAKEVGLAPLTKATHIVMMTNSRFTSTARKYADAVMENSSLAIYLLDEDDFKRVLDSTGGDLPAIMREQGERIASLPRRGLDWLPSTDRS